MKRGKLTKPPWKQAVEVLRELSSSSLDAVQEYITLRIEDKNMRPWDGGDLVSEC